MSAGLQRPFRDLVVGVVDGQVDDDVDGVIGEEVVEGGVRLDAMRAREDRSPIRVSIGGGHEADLGMGPDVIGVAARDVAGPDDSKAEGGHGRTGYGIRTPVSAVQRGPGPGYRPTMRDDQIALQLWTVRDQMAVDLPGTLRAVAAAGYRSVELAAVADVATDELVRHLEGARLHAVAAHEGIERLRADTGALIDRLTALGCPQLIIPWLPEEERRDRAGVRRFAAELGRAASQLGAAGIRIGYHNHDFEFAPLDGTTVWDILLAELPADVDLELDVYWAAVGGRDPAAEIRAASGRVRLLHMKDRAPGSEPHDAPAGEGTLGFPEIVAAARDANVAWYIVEQDEPADVLADISRAYAYLSDLAS